MAPWRRSDLTMNTQVAAPYYFDEAPIQKYGPVIAEFSNGQHALMFATLMSENGDTCCVCAGINRFPFAVRPVLR